MSEHHAHQLRGLPSEVRFAVATALAFIEAAARLRGVDPGPMVRRFGPCALGSLVRAAAARPDGATVLRDLALGLVDEMAPAPTSATAGDASRDVFPALPPHRLPLGLVELRDHVLRGSKSWAR